MKAFFIIVGLIGFSCLAIYELYSEPENYCPDYVLLKNSYPVVTFHGFVEDDVQCQQIAEYYNKLEREGYHSFKGYFSCVRKDSIK